MTTKPQANLQPVGEMLFGYERSAGTFDEMLDASGDARPHWNQFIEALAGLSPRERQARAARLDRQVRETGLVHDIFADPTADQAQWRLNLVPFIISAEEWRWLERAVDQRARLFNAILADIYGDQKLMRDGLVPAALVFSDHSYLRNCQGIDPPGGHLQFYAADLARGPDGNWRIIDSHAETPAGIGYVVANRIMHSDVTDDLFAECGTRRLATHFHKLQAHLIARTGRSDPSIALLTPGPEHDDYFSHAYFARYMGVHLVEGGDLRVVGDHVYLKTLAGLRPVDGIIRCIEGAKADPLELDQSSFDAPVGLLNACRRSPGLSANAIGSAIIENRGIGGYLPALCRHLLDEDLLLWPAPRWWLGDETARAHVAGVLDETMIIRPVREGTGRPGRATHGRATARMSSTDRDLLLREIETYGTGLVAEHPIGFSTMPRFTNQGLRSQSIAIRLYAAGTKDGFSVLPGGIALAVDSQSAVALTASSGDTHDIWILADAPEKPYVSLWGPQLQTARIDRPQRTLQSRVADNLYWLGRYVERADWTMRVLRSALGHGRLEYFGSSWSGNAAEICLQLLLGKTAKHPAKAAPPASRSKNLVQLAATLAASREGDYSLEQSFSGIYRVASLTRDRLSLEAWRTVSAFQVGDRWHRRIEGASASELMDEIEDKLATIATFGGHMHESMTRNFGWYFLDMGRRLERAYNLCDALNALFSTTLSDESDAERLKYVLELADSYITYRSRYRVEPKLPLVLDLLMMDEANPRSLAYQLVALAKHLAALPQANEGTALSRERRILLELRTAVRLADVDALSESAGGVDRAALAKMLQHALAELPALSDAISRRYFRLVDDEPHRVATRSEPRR